MAIQRDFTQEEFEKFMGQQIHDLANEVVAGVGDATFSGCMDIAFNEMLNSTQYRKARDLAFRSVADVANSLEKAKITSDNYVKEVETKAEALHSFANTPGISLDERQQFRYDAYGADREVAAARQENEQLQKALKDQQAQIAELREMMEMFKHVKDKDD